MLISLPLPAFIIAIQYLLCRGNNIVMTEIRAALPGDTLVIQALAEATWGPTYGPILSPEQLRYMLDTMYSPDTIRRQIADNEQAYLLLLESGTPIGFASYAPRTENPDIYKLHKLYCLITTKGKGYGKLLMREVEKAVIAAGKHTLELNVNRHNPAIGFYEKMGFSIAYDEDIDIGNGYWMNDYVMRKEL